MFLNHTLNFHWDIENIFIKNPRKIGSVPIGHMSPITSLLIIFICITILLKRYNNSNIFKYIGGSLSLLVFLLSFVIILGYLYRAPMLYGSTIIPVSLLAAVCLLLFSITLILAFDLKFWTFNLIKDNKITLQLLKSFLPLAVFTVLLQGFLITNISIKQNSLTLIIALIALIVIAFIVFTVIKVSGNLGENLHEVEQALKASENKYRILVDNGGEGIGFVNPEEEFIYANSAAEKIFGRGKGELIGKNLKDFLSEEQYNNILLQSKIRKERQSSSYETELTLPYGKKLNILITAVPQFDGEVFVGTLGIFRDITDRKNAEIALAESLQFNLQIINSLEEGIIVYDKNLRYTVWNPFMEKLTGLPASLVIGKYPTELFPFLEDVGVIDNLKKTLNGEVFDATDFPFNIPNTGKSGWTSDRNIPLRNVTGEVIGVVGTVYDITERKKWEEILKSINERFDLATNASGISVWERDFITDIIKIDDNFNNIYGSPQGNYQIGFKEFIKYIHPDDVDIIKTNIEEAIKSDKNMNYEFRIIRPDGDIRNINAYGKIVKDKTNKPVKFIGVNFDISDFRKAELSLKEDERILFQLNNDKDRFISILGHDLKNPFNNLLGLTEVLKEDFHKLNTDEVENIANDINKSARTTYKLLEDILMWARTQQGKIPFKPQQLSLTGICNNILETLTPNAEVKNITIDYSATDHVYVFADIDMLKTVLRNLVSNAIKFTNNDGVINISAERTQSDLTISVSDNGSGISPDKITKLFDVGQVLTTNGTAGETGTGLGLLLCKEFVTKHGGKIWVDSEVGKGSKFKFTLPFSAEPDEINVVKNDVSSAEADSNITNLKILITDDDEASRKFLGFTVKALAKEILYAQNGFEAVVACQDNPDVDLILMDIKMPEMDGFEATRQIRQFNKEVVIIMQTAYAGSGEKEKVIEAGCNDFITKPINKTLLQELIKKACQ